MQTTQDNLGALHYEAFTAPKEEFVEQMMNDRMKHLSAKGHTFVRRDRKIGRNDPCPCGSGEKFKKCHLPGAITK